MIQAVLGFATDLGERSGAWDEVYYTLHDSIPDAITAWTATSGLLSLQRTSLMGRRLQCLSDQCYLYYIRWSLVGTRGKSQTQSYRIDGYRGSENFAGDACVFRAYNTVANAHREIRLGGIPDNVVDGNQLQTAFWKQYVCGPNPASPAPGTFYRALVDATGCINVRTTTIGGGSSQALTGFVKANQGDNLTVNLAGGITIPAGSKVDISIRGQPQLRGRWTVASQPTSTSIVLAGSARYSGPLTATGFVTIVAMDGSQLGRFDFPYLSAHKLGKKKYQRRGRQSVKLLRH